MYFHLWQPEFGKQGLGTQILCEKEIALKLCVCFFSGCCVKKTFFTSGTETEEMPEDCSRFEELEMRELSVEASRETETVPDFTCRSDFF